MQLIITEKPSACLKIATALADKTPKKVSIASVSYYEITHNKKPIIVACAVGHLFGLKEKIKTGNYPVQELEWVANDNFSKKYATVIRKLAKHADDFVVACDYDIEGETIGYNIIRFLCNQKDAKRMKFSTLTKPELVESYSKMQNTLDWGQAIAGETRHNLDFMYGISLSRALMKAIKHGGIFRKLSIGRVQGPTLEILTEKEREIKAFKPIQYWQVSLNITTTQGDLLVTFPKRILKKDELKDFLELKGSTAEIKTEKEEVSWPPPHPFDLTTLQTESYKYLGLTPAQTLQVAQSLYLEGIISYPRTSSQKLPAAIGYKSILEKLKKTLPGVASKLTRRTPIEGKQSDPAHPSIYPTGETPKKLDATARKLYNLIVRRFLACFAADAIIENKKITVTTENNNKFTTKGLQIKEKGWLDIYQARTEEKEIPDINGKVKIKEVKTEEKETKPPKRYTPASIVSELTKRGLGTKGTRANIIETLFERGYAKDRSITVTDLGLSVEKALAKYSPLILDEKLTREFTEEMEKIQSEKNETKIKTAAEKTIKNARTVLEKISNQIRENEVKMGKVLAKGLTATREQEKADNILSKCVCGQNSIVRISRKSRKRFVACSGYPKCTITFPLPQAGFLKKSDKKCEKCGRNMIMILTRGRKPWTLCFAGCGWDKEKGKEVTISSE